MFPSVSLATFVKFQATLALGCKSPVSPLHSVRWQLWSNSQQNVSLYDSLPISWLMLQLGAIPELSRTVFTLWIFINQAIATLSIDMWSSFVRALCGVFKLGSFSICEQSGVSQKALSLAGIILDTGKLFSLCGTNKEKTISFNTNAISIFTKETSLLLCLSAICCSCLKQNLVFCGNILCLQLPSNHCCQPCTKNRSILQKQKFLWSSAKWRMIAVWNMWKDCFGMEILIHFPLEKGSFAQEPFAEKVQFHGTFAPTMFGRKVISQKAETSHWFLTFSSHLLHWRFCWARKRAMKCQCQLNRFTWGLHMCW